MDNPINIHERIQEMMKIKFKGKKQNSLQNPISHKKVKSKLSRPQQLAKSQIGRTQLFQEEDQADDTRYSENQIHNSRLLNRASQIMKVRQIGKKKQKIIQVSPQYLETQKNMIQSIISKFEEVPEDVLLEQSQKKMNIKIQPVSINESRCVTQRCKLPIIGNINSSLIVQRKKGRYDWGSDQFRFKQQQNIPIKDQMQAFIRQVDKQKLKHENFKIKVHNEIDKIQRLKNKSFHQKKLGELCEMKSSYNFHDLFLRYRKLNNHENIQKI